MPNLRNIKLENIDIPKTVGSFKSLKITGNTEKFNIENNKIENDFVSNTSLKIR